MALRYLRNYAPPSVFVLVKRFLNEDSPFKVSLPWTWARAVKVSKIFAERTFYSFQTLQNVRACLISLMVISSFLQYSASCAHFVESEVQTTLLSVCLVTWTEIPGRSCLMGGAREVGFTNMPACCDSNARYVGRKNRVKKHKPNVNNWP